MRPSIKDVNEEDLASVLEQEMQRTAELIARAEARFKVCYPVALRNIWPCLISLEGKKFGPICL